MTKSKKKIFHKSKSEPEPAGVIISYKPKYVPEPAVRDGILGNLEPIPLLKLVLSKDGTGGIKLFPPTKPGFDSGEIPGIMAPQFFLDIDYNDPHPRKEIIPGVLHIGTKLMLGSSSKAGKTWQLIQMAAAVSSGKDWFPESNGKRNFPTNKSRVLYINFELHDDFFQKRCELIADKMGIPSKDMFSVLNLRGYETAIATLRPQIIDQIEKQKTPFELIIIDPIYKSYGELQENVAGDMAAFMNHLEAISVATGAAIVFCAHFTKGEQMGKTAMDRVSGSGVFARDADTIVTLTEVPRHAMKPVSGQNLFTVEMETRNYARHEPFIVERTFPLFKIRDDLLVDLSGKDPKLSLASGASPTTAPTKEPAEPVPAAPTASVAISHEPKGVGRPKAMEDEDTLLDLLPLEGLRDKDWEKIAMDTLAIGDGTYKKYKTKLIEAGKVEKAGKVFLKKTSPTPLGSSDESTTSTGEGMSISDF